MHHPTDGITHTTVFVTPVVEHWLEREIAQWVHPMKDRSDDPSDRITQSADQRETCIDTFLTITARTNMSMIDMIAISSLSIARM